MENKIQELEDEITDLKMELEQAAHDIDMLHSELAADKEGCDIEHNHTTDRVLALERRLDTLETTLLAIGERSPY